MRATQGEAGYGVYAYPDSAAAALRPYYTARGERVFRLMPRPEAEVIDLTTPAVMQDLLAFADREFARMAAAMPGYQVPRVTAKTVQRFGRVLEQFMRARYAEAAGHIVWHAGPGIPTAKQAVLTKPDAFTVQEWTVAREASMVRRGRGR